jgi:hypothetical protein
MASQQQLNTELSRVFFSDITNLYPQSQRQYDCTGISDLHYCQLGVLRCLSSSVTGQEFLQYHADQNVADIEPSHFFKALKSGRRLENITSLNNLLASSMKKHVADPFAQCSELDGWDVYAVDGHYASSKSKRNGERDAQIEISEYIDYYYNTKRKHSSIAYKPPSNSKKT